MAREANITRICNQVVEANRPVKVDWGFHFLVNGELDALRIAYAYRYNKHGVKVKYCPAPDQYMVTVFNEVATSAGLDNG